MKVQIGVRITPLNGYMNIDFAAQPNEQDRALLQDAMKLYTLVDANECLQMVCNDIFDFFPLQNRSQILNHWLTRIAHSGRIIIGGTDPYEVARMIHGSSLNLEQANSVLYGMGKKSLVTPREIIQMVASTGQFDLEESLYTNTFNYIVKFIRK